MWAIIIYEFNGTVHNQNIMNRTNEKFNWKKYLFLFYSNTRSFRNEEVDIWRFHMSLWREHKCSNVLVTELIFLSTNSRTVGNCFCLHIPSSCSYSLIHSFTTISHNGESVWTQLLFVWILLHPLFELPIRTIYYDCYAVKDYLI